MGFKTVIKLFAGDVVKESKIDKDGKIQLLNYIKEADVFEVINLLNSGKIEKIDESKKPIVLKEFKNSEVPKKIKYFVNENENIQEEVASTIVAIWAYLALGIFSSMAIAGSAAIGKKIALQFQKCHHQCKKLQNQGSTPEYQTCKKRCELESLKNKLKALKSLNCSKSKNPEKCKEKVKKNISKTEKRIKKVSGQLKKYTG